MIPSFFNAYTPSKLLDFIIIITKKKLNDVGKRYSFLNKIPLIFIMFFYMIFFTYGFFVLFYYNDFFKIIFMILFFNIELVKNLNLNFFSFYFVYI